MPPSQRLASSLVVLAVVGGLTALGLSRSATQYVPLALGAATAEDVDAIEQTLRDQRLTGFRRDGTQLLVPADRLADFDSALRSSESGPVNWAADWEQKVHETNPFTSSQELRAIKDIALAKELRRIILDLDGIEDASVVWADSDARSRWGASRRRVTATVNVRPAEGVALPLQTIRGIQFSVAHMVPDLQPEDVVVFDLSAGRHYQLDPAQARFETDLTLWREEQLTAWSARLEARVRKSWSDARVQVSVDEMSLRDLAWSLAVGLETNSNDAVESHSQIAANRPLQLYSAASHSPKPAAETEVAFGAIQSQLSERFPELLQLNITFAADALAELVPDGEPGGWESAAGAVRLQELHAAILAELPAAVPPASLRVAVETRAAGTTESPAAGPVTISPGLLLIAVGGCLAAFALAWRSMTARPAVPVVPAVEPDHAATVTPPGERAATMSPLGDPETVALVLQNWLTRGATPDRTRNDGT